MRAVFAAALAGVMALAGIGVVAAGQEPHQATALPVTSGQPAPGTSVAMAAGNATVVAWLEQTADSRRVIAAVGTPALSTRLGPAGPGIDGAPAATAGGDGSVWVVASRNAGGTQRLWTQRWVDGGWQAPLQGPISRLFDHHPAIASDPSSTELWATWIGDDGYNRNNTMLYASRWTGRDWTPAEPLPRTFGAPMAPSITIDAVGNPVVVWAASDGADAEIWVSVRRSGRWSTPQALSRNLVPDIMPSVEKVGDGLLVAWISYTEEGYLPLARLGDSANEWDDVFVVDEAPGGRPRAASVSGMPAVFWRRLEDEPVGGTVVARVRGREGWRPSVELVSASGSPFAVVNAPDGRLMLGFTRPNGRIGVAESGAMVSRDALQGLAAAGVAKFGRPLSAGLALPSPAPAPTADPGATIVPRIYTAFGDSITNGILYDPERRETGGYPEPLQQMVQAAFGLGTVFKEGVDGEVSADGVGRIDNVIADTDPGVITIMEGTNDIVSAIEVDVIAFNLQRMVERSYEEKADILPLLAQIPPRLDPGPEGFDGPGNGRIDELNELILNISISQPVTIVDQNTPIDGHFELMSNPLHPSAAGYQVMAETWFEAVEPLVLALTNRGDVDASGRTDGLDLVLLAMAFGAMVGEERWDADADINGDGIVDGFDLDILIEFFGQDAPDSVGR